jgi:predicted secreted protein
MRLAHLLAAVLVAVAPAFAQEKQPSPEAKRDIEAHRTLAQAHENAARCLESGKPEKECHAQLEKDCKGVGIGKYCGMRHKH